MSAYSLRLGKSAPHLFYKLPLLGLGDPSGGCALISLEARSDSISNSSLHHWIACQEIQAAMQVDYPFQ